MHEKANTVQTSACEYVDAILQLCVFLFLFFHNVIQVYVL